MSQPPTDIVRELRQRHTNATGLDPRITTPINGPTIFLQAADEIERLHAELDRLGPLMLRAFAEITQLRAERDELRECLRRSNQALDSLAGYAAPE